MRRLRPNMAWEDLLRIVNGPLVRRAALDAKPPAARRERLCLRGFLPDTVLAPAGRRAMDDRLSAIKGADSDITLNAICNRLEAMR